MNCANCNAPLEPHTRFCPKCGAPVGQFPSATPSPLYQTLPTNKSPINPLASQQPPRKPYQPLQAPQTPAQWPQSQKPSQKVTPMRRWILVAGLFLIAIAATIWIKSSLTNSQSVVSTLIVIFIGVVGLLTSFIQTLLALFPGGSWFQSPAWLTSVYGNVGLVKSINFGIPIIGTIGIIVALIIPYSTPTPSTPNPAQALLGKVEGLAPGVNINVYQSKFGAPTFINSNGVNNAKEYVFVNTYFYLDAITDTNDEVLLFAVTIRDRTFNPVFKSPGYPVSVPSFQITLGISKFSDVLERPEYIVACLGAHNFNYYETHYLGNPGDYEDFGFGLNQAGYSPSNVDFSGFNSNPQFCPGTSAYTDQDLQNLNVLRTQTIFNTYAVSAPSLSIKDYAGSNLGVSYDQVRTLNP